MKKVDLAERIRVALGHPMVKVELDQRQIYQSIDLARQKWIKWAVGQSTQEVFFTIPLSAGTNFYDMPLGVTEILGYYDDQFRSGGINTLFTLENWLFYNEGWWANTWPTGEGYTILSYHIARDFLDTLRKYTPLQYNYKYHKYTNQLEVHPAPASGNSLSVTTTAGTTEVIDSPGYLLIRSMMLQGSTVDDWAAGDSNNYFYGEDWIFDFSLAESKVMLGRVRNKFAAFAGLGNTGITLDGDQLISEGNEEKTDLLERLKLEEVYEGGEIMIG
jgi:hypothetical protein